MFYVCNYNRLLRPCPNCGRPSQRRAVPGAQPPGLNAGSQRRPSCAPSGGAALTSASSPRGVSSGVECSAPCAMAAAEGWAGRLLLSGCCTSLQVPAPKEQFARSDSMLKVWLHVHHLIAMPLSRPRPPQLWFPDRNFAGFPPPGMHSIHPHKGHGGCGREIDVECVRVTVASMCLLRADGADRRKRDRDS